MTGQENASGLVAVTRVSSVSVERQLALRHQLPSAVAGRLATPSWVRSRIELHAAVAGVDIEAHTDPITYGLTVGRDVVMRWGEADRSGLQRHVFVNDSVGLTRGRVEGVVAHEVCHHLMWSAGHRRRFFVRVQELLDEVAALSPTENQ